MTSKLQCFPLVYRSCDFHCTVLPLVYMSSGVLCTFLPVGLWAMRLPSHNASHWSIGHVTFPTVFPIGLDRSCDYDSASHWSIGHVTITVFPTGPWDFMALPSYSACYWSTGYVTSPVQSLILVYGPCDILSTVVHRMSCDLILQYSDSHWSIGNAT